MNADLDDRSTILIYGSFLPPDRPCGVSSSVRTFLGSPIRERYDLDCVSDYREAGADRGIVRRLGFGCWLLCSSGYKMISSRARVVDVHAVSDSDFLKQAAVVFAARLTGRPVILRIHGGDFEQVYERDSGFGKWLTRMILRMPDRVVLLSEGWLEIVRRIEPEANAMVIPNSIDCAEFEAIGSERQRTARRILLLGNLCERKGHFDALDALAEVHKVWPDCEMAFAGDERDEGSRAELEERTEALGLSGSVHFLGPVFGEEKARAFREAGLFILPSHTENMPIAIMEAMASALPTVATRVGAVGEMIRDGDTGMLVNAHDSAGLADRIQALLADEATRDRVARRAQVYARETWDRAVIADRTATLYRELSGDTRP